MPFSILHKDRTVRATVIMPEGQTLVVENLRGNEGFYMSFECTRTMDDSPGEASLTFHNLPPDILGALESAQTSKVDDLDALLVGKGLVPQVAADGSDALAAGYLIAEVEAGYDGECSRLFRAVGARSASAPDADDVTIITSIRATENLDGALLGLPVAAFEAGTTLFAVLDYLRRSAGLGPGNLSPASLAAILGQSVISSPYVVSGGQALEHIKSVLQYLPLRWFIDDRDIWVCARDEVPSPVIPPAPPWIADGPPELLPPIIGRPQRDDAGRVTLTTFLASAVRPGRLVRLTQDGLALAQQGLSASAAQVRRANVPPGLYRAEVVAHSGDTGARLLITNFTLRPIISPDYLTA